MSAEPKAWHCPNCNTYHAPHVDTCPKPKPPVTLGGQHSYTQNAAAMGQNWEALRNAQQAAQLSAGLANSFGLGDDT